MEKRITKFDCCKQEINVPGTVAELSTLTAELGSTNMVFPEPHTNPSALDCEESEEDSYDDVDDNDEDADIPYFSDIETMVNITKFQIFFFHMICYLVHYYVPPSTTYICYFPDT